MKLETTGERVIKDSYFSSADRYLIYLFHKITYDFAAEYVQDKRVLDYGCGSGYGSHQLANSCREIIGIDISEEAVAFARENYQANNLDYQVVAPAQDETLPFADDSFDTVVSFQVIEHILPADPYLSEIRRVLKPGGVFLCATPDRSSRLLPGQKPWNPWHKKEYGKNSFRNLLANYFTSVDVFGMGGKPEVLKIEIDRTRRAMWLTLPFTLPIVPDFLRVKLLNAIKRLRGSQTSEEPCADKKFDFDENDLFIASDANPSTNLIAVARI